MKLRRLSAALLAACLALSLAACGPDSQESPSPSQSSSPPPPHNEGPPPSDVPRQEVNLAVLSGPTGVGAAKLLSDSEAGTTMNDYHFTVEADNQQIVALLSSGEADIAAMATNMAANYYWKSEGSIQVIALNTLGVLYILEGNGGESIQSLEDLRGRTLYATGEGANPEYVINYLLEQNGLTPGEDVTIEWLTAEEVSAKMLSGDAECCMLPVPAATALMMQSDGQVRQAVDLTEQWDALNSGSVLTMGCMVVRTQFAQEHPEAVAQFLEEYAQSITYVSDNPEEAAELVAQYGITPSAQIAAQAIPQCNLVCITGEDIRVNVEGYYSVLYQANPASIGGSLPDDAFYYAP